MDVGAKEIVALEVAWRKCSRSILKVSPRTHNNLIPDLMNSRDLKTILEERFLNFYINGLSHYNDFISLIFKNTFIHSTSFIVRNVNRILLKNKLL